MAKMNSAQSAGDADRSIGAILVDNGRLSLEDALTALPGFILARDH